MRLLVTGGAGFIGSAFVRLAVRGGHGVTVLDKLTYAGDLARIGECRDRVRFYRGDICNRDLAASIIEREGIEAIVHFAAESHVDRSIEDASPFIQANVLGTQALLDLTREYRLKKFVHISTDEVYGQLGEEGMFTEQSPFNPNSPYAASKAAADMLARAYHHTYGLPVCIVRACNNYGPWQFPEKLIPLAVARALQGRRVPVYARGLNVREWLYVDDCCAGVLAVLERGAPGEAYNIGSGQERRNIDVVRSILELAGEEGGLAGRELTGRELTGKDITGKDAIREGQTGESLAGESQTGRGLTEKEMIDQGMIEFVADRPGHDFRYRLDSSRAERELGFRAGTAFEDGLRQTVAWCLANRGWLLGKL